MAQLFAERTCPRCNTVFMPTSPYAGRKRYCSHRCRTAAWAAAHVGQKARHRRRWLNKTGDEAYRAYQRRWYVKHRESRCVARRELYRAQREQCRQRNLAKALEGMPDDPFVREILTALFMVSSEARRAAYARKRGDVADHR